MEVTDANLQQLAGYLEKTLLPDVTERRGGMYFIMAEIYDILQHLLYPKQYTALSPERWALHS